MASESNFIDTVNSVIQTGVEKGILHLSVSDIQSINSTFCLNNIQYHNFGSCSYLGLESHSAMKQNSMDTIQKYGTQFSSSRAYLSIDLYRELENLLEQVFERYVVISQTTSLGHIASLPVLVRENDAVIIDHQVHNSVQTASQILKAKNIHVEMIRHNRMDILEERIQELQQSHNKVWYLADGIYSMYGDPAPLKELKFLLDKYEKFNLYIDDAHGMSCYGKNGRGFVLTELLDSEKAVVVVSLNKAFASGGAAILLKNKNQARLIRTCGGPLITSGPLQPAQLGSAIAAAKIHLSDEIYILQKKLHQNITYANLLLKKYELPLVFESNSPVFYVAAGKPKIAYEVIQGMMEKGFYLNLGTFPAVPIKNSGIRFTITAVHTFKMILSMIESLHEVYFDVLEKNETSMESVYKAFKMTPPSTMIINQNKTEFGLQVIRAKSIQEINEKEWNSVMENKGIFNVKGLRVLESSFANHKNDLIKWDFDYLIVKNLNNEIVLATFFTTAWMKDDMLASETVSGEIEEIRMISNNPYYHSNKMVTVGSLFSEGEHLYFNSNDKNCLNAFRIFYKEAESIMENREASGIIIRDFYEERNEVKEWMTENGFFKIPMPNSFHLEFNDQSSENYFNSLSKNSKMNLKREVLRFWDDYSFKVEDNISENVLEELYELYLQVKCKSLQLNTYDLPFELFLEMNRSENWEFLVLREALNQKIVGFISAFKTSTVYHPMLVGIDKTTERIKSPYRQLLYRMSVHAQEQNFKEVRLGFSADVEKKKIGGIKRSSIAYMQVKDNYIFESLQYKTSDSQLIEV